MNLSATVREVLPSLEAKDTEAPVINSLRKEVDQPSARVLEIRQARPGAVFQPVLRFQTQQMGIR